MPATDTLPKKPRVADTVRDALFSDFKDRMYPPRLRLPADPVVKSAAFGHLLESVEQAAYTALTTAMPDLPLGWATTVAGSYRDKVASLYERNVLTGDYELRDPPPAE